MSMKESNFQKSLTERLFRYFLMVFISCKTVLLRNSFSLKHLTYWQLVELIIAKALKGYFFSRK